MQPSPGRAGETRVVANSCRNYRALIRAIRDFVAAFLTLRRDGLKVPAVFPIGEASPMSTHARMLLLAAMALLAACGDGAEQPREAALPLTPCRVPHVESEVKCATLSVFENRETRQGRKIGINVVVLPATARIKEPDSLFIFAGGPGQAATDLARESLAIIGGLNGKRDIVLTFFVPQR